MYKRQFLFTRGGVTNELLLHLLFYIIITPVITLTMTKLMYMSENNMLDRKSTRLNSSHLKLSRMPSSA